MSFENPTSGSENKSEKQQRWEEIEQSLRGTADDLNPEIDKGIFDTVVALNAFGLHTCGSCEGHVGVEHDNEHPFPWVSLQAPNRPDRYANEENIMPKLLEKYATAAGKKGPPYDEEIYNQALNELETYPETAEYKKWIEETERMASHLQKLLDEFYEHREVKPLVKLRAERQPESFSLNSGSHGQMVREGTSDKRQEALQKLLVRYQEEMRVFTEFLKRRYFTG